MSDTLEWLTTVPPSDENFKSQLRKARTETAEKALLENARLGRKSGYNGVLAELKRRAKSGVVLGLKELPDFEAMRKSLGMFAQPTPGEIELVRSGETAVAVVAEATVSEQFATARTYHDMARASMAQSAAFMVLCGVELARLHKLHAVRPGQPKKNSRNAAGILWPELVKREMGISEDTARRYMEMAHAAKRRVPELNAEELLNTPLKALPDLRREKLMKAVQKVTDGQTAQQLMWDWGIAKKPHGHALRGSAGGDKGGRRGAGAKEPAPEEEHAQRKEWARASLNTLITGLRDCRDEKFWELWPKDGDADQEKLTELAELIEAVARGVGPLLRQGKLTVTLK